MAPPRTVVTTSSWSLLLIYRPRKNERLSWSSWLTYSGRFTHISGHPSAVGRAQDSESSPVKDQRSTASWATQSTSAINAISSTETDEQRRKTAAMCSSRHRFVCEGHQLRSLTANSANVVEAAARSRVLSSTKWLITAALQTGFTTQRRPLSFGSLVISEVQTGTVKCSQ